MRVLVVGDIHGLLPQFAAWLERAHEKHRIDAAIQVGDFGFFRKQFRELFELDVRFAVPVHAIDGNHEDHHWLEQQLRDGRVAQWREELNLIYQPRGSLAQFGATTVGFLGGALHVDQPQQVHRASQTSNYIMRHQQEGAVELFNRVRPALLVTHSCPAGIGIGLQGNPEMAHGVATHVVGAGFDPGPPEDCGDTELTRLWTALEYRPRAWVFGHFHVVHATRVEDTQFACPGAISRRGGIETLLIWDTERQEFVD